MKARWHRGASLVAATLLWSGALASGTGCSKASAPAAAEKSEVAKAKTDPQTAAAEPAPLATGPTGPREAPPLAAPSSMATGESLAMKEGKAAAPPRAGGGAPAGRSAFDAPGVGGAPQKPGDGFGAAPSAMPSIAAAPAPASTPVPIDANGRFATTYRPGGGHLASFESAVARGIIPAEEREVVSDVGARYAPAIDAPKGKALALRTDFERAKLAPGGGPFHVRLALRSSADKATERPHLSVHLVLDVSGSMAGESITRARDAARVLVDKLAPTDDFSFVTFSSEAQVLVPDGPVGPRREAIKKVISEVREGGGTNISGGLQLGYAQAAAKTIPADAVRVVLLLSDGRATAASPRRTRSRGSRSAPSRAASRPAPSASAPTTTAP